MGGPSGGSTGGGLSNSSAATSGSGDAGGQSGSGNKQFNFGANPNAARATTSIENTLSNPFVIVGVVAAIWLITRKRRR